MPYPYRGLTLNQGETSQGKGRVNDHPKAPAPVPWSSGAKQGHTALRLDLDLGEALPQSVGQRSEVVLAIIEHALGVIEIEQRPRRPVRRDPAAEDGRAEQHGAFVHQRPQMIYRRKLLAHAAGQAMQHIGEVDGGERQ